jgi:hypothetical protein
MCKCTPEIRTPYCGKFGCEWPERKYRCGECGGQNIKTANAKGRFFPYKSYSRVELIVDLNLYTCCDCDNYILVGGDSERLDRAIEDSLDKGCFRELWFS